MEFDFLDQIPAQINDVANTIEDPLISFALRIMTILFAIQLAWGIADTILRGGFINDFIEWFVRQFVMISFFAAVTRGWSTITDWVINTFRDGANQAGGFSVTLTPSAILGTGANLVNELIATASLLKATGWMIVLLGLLIMLAFVVMVIVTILTLAETYLVTSGAVAFMGYAGSGWTSPMAIAQLRYVAGAAAKIFLLVFLLGVFNVMALNWVDTFQGGTAGVRDVLIVLGLAGVAAAMMWILPQMAQGFVSGNSVGYGGALANAGRFSAAALGGLTSSISSGVVNAIGSAKLISAAKNEAIASGAGKDVEGARRIAQISQATFGNAMGAIGSMQAAKLAGTASHHANSVWGAAHRSQRNADDLNASALRVKDAETQARLDRRHDAATDSRKQVAGHVRAASQEKRDEAQKARISASRGSTNSPAGSQREKAAEIARTERHEAEQGRRQEAAHRGQKQSASHARAVSQEKRDGVAVARVIARREQTQQANKRTEDREAAKQGNDESYRYKGGNRRDGQ